jgi:hypothetical protein
MTAIFAYADSEVAFVASDTKRETLGYPTVACKTTRWSENIIISQTGFGEGLQRLVGEMLAWQHRHPTMLTGAGVVHAFNQLAANRLAAEIGMLKHPANAPTVSGTLVVIEAPRGGLPGTIFTLDWVTQTQVPQPGPVYADGTNQPAFLAIAQAKFKSMGSGGSGFDLAAWGLSCIDEAKTHMNGAAVDWPADLTICRSDKGMLVSLVQRVAGPSSPTHPLFVV